MAKPMVLDAAGPVVGGDSSPIMVGSRDCFEGCKSFVEVDCAVPERLRDDGVEP